MDDDKKNANRIATVQPVTRLLPADIRRRVAPDVLTGLMAAFFWVTPAAAFTFASEPNLPVSGQSLAGNVTAVATATLVTAAVQSPRLANFRQETPSAEVQELADWVVDSANNQTLPFLIIDKVQARVFAFDPRGELRGAASALLGLAVGDDSVPGIGTRKLSSIRPEERTTPAGRFVASLAKGLRGEEMLWVDYDTSISLHRVVTSLPKERRAERLASPSPLDNRISYGCINVSARFYDDVVSPAFTGTDGIVYILPETRSARDVFGSYDVRARASVQTASQNSIPTPVQSATGN